MGPEPVRVPPGERRRPTQRKPHQEGPSGGKDLGRRQPGVMSTVSQCGEEQHQGSVGEQERECAHKVQGTGRSPLPDIMQIIGLTVTGPGQALNETAPPLQLPASDTLSLMRFSWPVLCPHCSALLTLEYEAHRLRAAVCPNGHRFDAARQGYVNLLAGRRVKFLPDTAPMIMARERVQNSGVFDALSQALHTVLSADAQCPDHAAAPLILDCGAGTGHYLHQLLENHPEAHGIALDLSPAGLKRAARHPRTLALTWDLWQPLPLPDGAADLVLNVFAPRNPPEYARVLRPEGLVAVALPRPDHLLQLRSAGLLGQQQEKRKHLTEQMQPQFGAPIAHHRLSSQLRLSAELAADLVLMGPAGHHRDPAEVHASAAALQAEQITVDLDLLLWRKPPSDLGVSSR